MKDLYISLSSNILSKDQILQYLESKKEEKKILALQTMVIFMSQGIDCNEFVGVTIREIIPYDKNKDLKRLFYYYLELMDKVDKKGRLLAEMLLLTNQIRKDISHPNEYVRALAMRLAAKLDQYEIIEMLFKPIKDNLTHFHPNVRTTAFYCLAEIYKKFKENCEEVPELIFNRLKVEGDCNALIQGYISLKDIDNNLYNEFNKKIKIEIQDPLFLELLVENIEDINLLHRLADIKDNRVALKSLLKLLEKVKEETKKKVIADKIINLMVHRENDDIMDSGFIVITRYPSVFKGETQPFLSILNNFNRIQNFMDFILEISDVQDYPLIENYLLDKFYACFDKVQKSFILKKLQLLSENYYSERTLNVLSECIVSDSPELAYEAVGILSQINNQEILLKGLKSTKFGKVFRFILSTLSEKIEDPNVMYNIIQEIVDNKDIKEPIFFTFRDTTKMFFGADLSLAMVTVINNYEKILKEDNKKEKGDDKLKERVVELFIKIIKIGKEYKIMDKNSYNMIVICIKNIKEGKKEIGINEIEERILFDVYSILPQEKKKEIIEEEDFSRERIFQLTGLGDHLFIEAKLSCTLLSIDLEILIVNQTANLLQNVSFDFTTSNNMQENFSSQPFLLKPRTAKNLNFSFSITEIFNSFITGTVIFNFSDKGTLKNYILNLSEIKILLSDFLHPTRLSEEIFRKKWVALEWENTYTYRFHTSLSLSSLLDEISYHLKAYIIRTEEEEEYLVANLCTTTLQGDEILINLTLQKNEMVTFDCRIRSQKEVLVKALTTILGDCLKEVK